MVRHFPVQRKRTVLSAAPRLENKAGARAGRACCRFPPRWKLLVLLPILFFFATGKGRVAVPSTHTPVREGRRGGRPKAG
eukprot:gene15024-biopygen23156